MFSDRSEGGRQLAERLTRLRSSNPVVVGLPRGGIPVAYEVAKVLDAPLDVIVVRKVGVPWQPELAMGAVGEDGVSVVDSTVVRAAGVDIAEFTAAENAARVELERRVQLVRHDHPRVPLAGRTVIVIDDGIATGATARAACRVARAHGADRVVMAAPVGSPDAVDALLGVADEVVCPLQPAMFRAVGEWYQDFAQTTDKEMLALLTAATAHNAGYRGDVEVSAAGVQLPGRLTMPAEAPGIVVFAHGSGSSRHSPRNVYVADVLHQAGLGTLLFDLLTPGEEGNRQNVFDIGLLAGRLSGAVAWLRTRPECARARMGLFGASTGAAAALWAAAEQPAEIAAVVSRGGRPDLAGDRLAHVEAPTLLIVGGDDDVVIELNQLAQQRLRCTNRLVIVPGASHLFEEPGTLRAAAEHARDWFDQYLRP